MDATSKHRRFIWLAAIAVAVYFFAPQIIGYAFLMLFSHPQAVPHTAAAPKAAPPPKTVKAASPQPAAAVAAPTTAPAASAANVSVADAVTFANLYGNWQGRSALRNRRLCSLKFELRANQMPQRPYAGYSTLTCTPFWPYERRPNPTAAVMALKSHVHHSYRRSRARLHPVSRR